MTHFLHYRKELVTLACERLSYNAKTLRGMRTRAKIVVEHGKLCWWKLAVPEREFCFTATEGFVTPENTYEEFTAPEPEGHPEVLEAFAQSVLNGTEMIAEGKEGLNSLSISNAAYLSTWTNDWAEIPTEEALFEKYLKERCENEKSIKK